MIHHGGGQTNLAIWGLHWLLVLVFLWPGPRPFVHSHAESFLGHTTPAEFDRHLAIYHAGGLQAADAITAHLHWGFACPACPLPSDYPSEQQLTVLACGDLSGSSCELGQPHPAAVWMRVPSDGIVPNGYGHLSASSCSALFASLPKRVLFCVWTC